MKTLTIHEKRTRKVKELKQEERCALDMAEICENENLPHAAFAYLCDAAGYYLAAEILAGQTK